MKPNSIVLGVVALIVLGVGALALYSAMSDQATVLTITPKSGPIGTTITLRGIGFIPDDPNNPADNSNLIQFGQGYFDAEGVGSTTLQFVVPGELDICSPFAGYLCQSPKQPVAPGVYEVSVVEDSNSSSNRVTFTVTE